MNNFLNDHLIVVVVGDKPASFAAEVIADNSGKWCGNGLRFATASEANSYGNNLAAAFVDCMQRYPRASGRI